jgi:nitrogen regulatory protein PII
VRGQRRGDGERPWVEHKIHKRRSEERRVGWGDHTEELHEEMADQGLKIAQITKVEGKGKTHSVESVETIEVEVGSQEVHGRGEQASAHEVHDDVDDVFRDILLVLTGVHHADTGSVVAQLRRETGEGETSQRRSESSRGSEKAKVLVVR